LQNLPKTLDETYERILLDTDEEYRDVIVEALRWLCFSERTLTVRELAEAAVFSTYVEPPSKNAPLEIIFDEDALFQDPSDILKFLSGLVICVTDDDNDSSWEYDDTSQFNLAERPLEFITEESTIILSHFSVKEYLVSGRLRNEVEHFSMDEDHVHEILSTKCLYFLLYHHSSPSYPEDIADPSFFEYASREWHEHARKVDYESELTVLIISVFMTEHELRERFIDDLHFPESTSLGLTPLYIASSLGLYWPTKALLESGAAVNVKSGEYGNALQAAAGENQERIVQLLLDYGADVNMEGGTYGNALQVVSYLGHISIAKLLIDYGADINMRFYITKGFPTPLEQALAVWDKSMVQLLLDHGANVNTEAGYYDWYIDDDREFDSETLVMLLEHGAVFSKYRRCTGAEEALARKDFKGFEEILRKKWEEERENERKRMMGRVRMRVKVMEEEEKDEEDEEEEGVDFSRITNNSK
jgi:hypothetical protein